MITGDRRPCCVCGCRRTFKASVHPGSSEVMCGKHYRADPDLHRRHKDLNRRARRMLTILNRYFSSNRRTEAECEATYQRMIDRCSAAWDAIRANAQGLQDAGYWAPRPRKPSARKARTVGRDKLSDPFEREFQRLKAAHSVRS